MKPEVAQYRGMMLRSAEKCVAHAADFRKETERTSLMMLVASVASVASVAYSFAAAQSDGGPSAVLLLCAGLLIVTPLFLRGMSARLTRRCLGDRQEILDRMAAAIREYEEEHGE